MSMLMRNARLIHKFNKTEAWWRANATPALEIAARKEARRLDTGADEAEEREAVATTLKCKVRENLIDRTHKKVKVAAHVKHYNSQPVILDPGYWRCPDKINTHTVENLRLQVAWLRAHKAPMKGIAGLNKGPLIAAVAAMLDGLTPDLRRSLEKDAAQTTIAAESG